MRAEKPGKLPRTRPGDPTFARCGHENGGANLTPQGKCRACKNASQLAYLAKRAGKPAPRSAKTAAEPDPVQAKIAAAMERSKPLVADALRLGRAITATPGLIGAPHAAAAAKWRGQCPMLDSGSGKRCSLPGRHEMPHSASGRTFSAAAAINVAEMGGTVRELDQHAVRGAS